MKRMVAVNEQGLRIGDSHGNAKLSNREVELLLTLREEGWSYRKLADKFEISKGHARDICKGRRRCQTAMRFKEVCVPG